MKTIPLLFLALLCVMTLGACSGNDGPGPSREDNLSLDLPHPLKPQDEGIYRISNLKAPGKQVYLYSSPEKLARCIEAIDTGKDASKICSPNIAAKVPDGAMVRALDCHSSKYAICTVQVIEGEEASFQGAILWDWLMEKSQTPKAAQP